jgi:hypothetical protein
MSPAWPSVLPYSSESATSDTLHAHTQVLGKLGIVLAPHEAVAEHSDGRMMGSAV